MSTFPCDSLDDVRFHGLQDFISVTNKINNIIINLLLLKSISY